MPLCTPGSRPGWKNAGAVRYRAHTPIGEAHVKIAVGADYLDACPIRGVRTGGGTETLVAQAHLQAGEQ